MRNNEIKSAKAGLKQLSKFAPLPPYTLGFESRNIILETALILEKTTSSFLAELTHIAEPLNSLSFGSSSSSLSFYQKISLLIDLGALNKQDRSKFETFMQIRNKFMHVYEANSFENCFKFLEGSEKFLFKLYGKSPDESLEINLKNASIKLANDVLSLTFKIINKLENT